MSNGRLPPGWKNDIEQRLSELDHGLKAERAECERLVAEGVEDLYHLEQRVAALEEEKDRWAQRIAWLEKRVKVLAAKPRRPR